MVNVRGSGGRVISSCFETSSRLLRKWWLLVEGSLYFSSGWAVSDYVGRRMLYCRSSALSPQSCYHHPFLLIFVFEKHTSAELMPEILAKSHCGVHYRALGWLVPRTKIFNVYSPRVSVFAVQPEPGKRLWCVENDVEILHPLCNQCLSAHKGSMYLQGFHLRASLVRHGRVRPWLIFAFGLMIPEVRRAYESHHPDSLLCVTAEDPIRRKCLSHIHGCSVALVSISNGRGCFHWCFVAWKIQNHE